jgi:hypothetical protein
MQAVAPDALSSLRRTEIVTNSQCAIRATKALCGLKIAHCRNHEGSHIASCQSCQAQNPFQDNAVDDPISMDDCSRSHEKGHV